MATQRSSDPVLQEMPEYVAGINHRDWSTGQWRKMSKGIFTLRKDEPHCRCGKLAASRNQSQSP